MNGTIIPLSRFRADIAKSGSQRLREILSSRDVTAAVEGLDPLEIFSLTLEVGEGEVMDILALCDAEQMRRVVDIGIGRGDAPDFFALDRLFAAAAAHGPGSSARLFDKLEEPLQTLYLTHHLRVLEAPRDGEELPDAAPGVERFITPDGHFVIEVAPPKEGDPVDPSLPHSANDLPAGEAPFSSLPLVADLYASDWQRADTIMRDVRHAIRAELEEDVVRTRDARLEEMGFPPREDAARLFARRAAAGDELKRRAAHTLGRTSLPATYAEPFLADSFFARALGGVSEPELLAELESELIYVTNAACVFEQRLYGDVESVREAARDVRNLLSLGLETASSGDATLATRLLFEHPLRELFSFGLEQCYKLGDWAKRAEAQGLFRLPGLERRVLAAEDERFLSALLARVPRFFDGAPGDVAARAFASRRELGLAQKRLEGLGRGLLAVRAMGGAVGDFGHALEGCDPDALAVTLDQLLRSLLVRKSIGASVKDTLAVGADDLRAFRASASASWPEETLGRPPPEVEETLHAAWAALREDVERLGESPDPRFIHLITLAATR